MFHDKVPIERIIVKDRCREDLGNISSLAASLARLGMLQPIVVKPGFELACGERRLEAAKSLGWKEVPVHVAENLDELLLFLEAERDENTERKDFLPHEAVKKRKQLEEAEKAEAKKRQEEGRRKGGLTAGRSRPSKSHPPKEETSEKRQRESKNGDDRSRINYPIPVESPNPSVTDEANKSGTRTAAAVGYSRATLDRAEAVLDAAEKEPEKYGPIAEEMKQTGKVDPAYRKVKKIEMMGSVDPALLNPPRTAADDLMDLCKHVMARLAGVRSQHGEASVWAKTLPPGVTSALAGILRPVIRQFSNLESEVNKCLSDEKAS